MSITNYIDRQVIAGAPDEFKVAGIVFKRMRFNPIKYKSTFIINDHAFNINTEIDKNSGMCKAWCSFVNKEKTSLRNTSIQFFRESIDTRDAIVLVINDVRTVAVSFAQAAHKLAVLGADNSEVVYIKEDESGTDETEDGKQGVESDSTDDDDYGPVNPNCSEEGYMGLGGRSEHDHFVDSVY